MILMKYYIRVIFVLFFIAYAAEAQSNISGYWSGKIKMLTMNLDFQLKIEKSKKSFNAFMSIPSQKLTDYRLQVFTIKKNKVNFELPSQAGIAKFEGTLKADSINGKILQAGIQGSFYLVRGIKPAESPLTDLNKKEPLPYSEEEIAFKSGRILLSGTLTSPSEDGKYPAVVLLSGNGPQNRDEEIFGFKIFERIADHLTRNGFAVLRYDDRGVGGSTGNTMQSTSEDFAEDANAALEFLKKLPNIDTKKMGFIGHSEGASIAALAASESDKAAFLIFISGTGVPGGDVLLEQQRLILKSSGVSDELINLNLDLQKKINGTLRENKDLNEIRKDIRTFAEKDFETLNPEIKSSIQDKNAYINSTVQSQIQMFNNPWFRFFVQFDPATQLPKVKVPVLMIFGGLDLQVPADQNKPKMEDALKAGGNHNFKSVVFPKANHLYQNAGTGSPSEYDSLKKEFTEGFLETITDWIKSIIH